MDNMVAYLKLNHNVLNEAAKLGLIQIKNVANILSKEVKISNMYGRIKLRKPHAPMRPVGNTQNSLGYTINKIIIL